MTETRTSRCKTCWGDVVKRNGEWKHAPLPQGWINVRHPVHPE